MSDRALALAGAFNLRDLGGLRAAGGQLVAPRRLLRADSLSHLTAEDVAVLVDEVGLRLVIDLRTSVETELEGRGLLSDSRVGYLNLPLRATGRLREDMAPDTSDIDLASAYLVYLEHSVDSVLAVVTALADPANLPAVVHCTVGKDRTGVIVALVLQALGIESEEIVEDYAATSANVAAIFDRLRSRALYKEVRLHEMPASVFTAEADTMRRFLDRLTSEHGGAEAWLFDHGLPAVTLDALRTNLLTPASPLADLVRS